MYSWAVCRLNYSLVVLRSCWPISTNRNRVRTAGWSLQFLSCLLSWTPFSHMSCVQSNRKVGFKGMKFSIQLTRYLQSFIKFVQQFCLAFGKKDQKNTQYLPKKITVNNLFVFNKLYFQNCFLTLLTLKLCRNIKHLISKSQFWNCTI